MYAIVEIAGQQFKVENGQELLVHRLEGKEGDKVTFDNVLMTGDGAKLDLKAKSKVAAQIVEHLKGDKVVVFKKKRRKGYKIKNGHKQALTKIKIDKIG